MSTIIDYNKFAELAFASYSDLSSGMSNDMYVEALQRGDDGLSYTQATNFASTWTVIDQYDGMVEETYIDEFGQEHTFQNPTGLSVTLFEDSQGKQVVAIRGTNDLLDFETDAIDIALLGTPENMAQYAALSAQVQKWMDDGVLHSGFTVTGHSLGGFLAQALTAEYDPYVSAAYTYNSPGFTVQEGITNIETEFLDLLGVVAPNIPNEKIFNLRASEGLSATAGLGQMIGDVQGVFIEDQAPNLIANHYMVHLADSLAIYNLFTTVDPTLDVDTITGILNAYNVDNTSVLETALAAVGAIYGESFQTFETDRNTFYTNLYGLEKVVSQGTVQSLAEASSSEIEFAAREETAALFALVKMNPFVVTGVDYSNLNQDGLLDLANYSDNYLEDQALFLYHTTHTDAPSPTDYDIQFSDSTYGITASADNGTVDLTDDQHYIFGNLEGELIEGEGEEDHLYGMAGNDQIFGNGGNDYIEGGKGQDILKGGHGNDTFYVGGEDADYDEFQGGDDYDKIVGGAQDDTIRVHSLTSANSIEEIDGGAGTNFIKGTTGDDLIDLSGIAVSNIAGIDGGAGADTLTGTAGDDVLYGGDGDDYLAGGEGDDTMAGGLGVDTYVINGHDRIIDSGRNNIIWNGQLIAGVFQEEKDNPGAYRCISDAGDYNLAFLPSGELTLSAEDSITFVNQTSAADFVNGDFGITLLEPAPATDTTLTGTEYHDEMGILDVGTDPANWQLVCTSFPSGVAEASPFYSFDLSSEAPRLEIDGGDGNDYLFGFASHDEIFGGSGSDIINGNLTTWNGKAVTLTGDVEGDRLDGGAGGDFISGSGGVDQIAGGDGNDFLTGLDGGDSLSGGAGNDVLAGGSNADTLTGGDGDDILVGEGDFTTFYDPTPDNFLSFGVDFTASEAGYYTGYTSNNFFIQSDDLNGGDDILLGGAGRDWLDGGRGDDALDGGTESDTLIGGEGDDLLYGREGNDWLIGDNGDLTGAGNDTLYGGSGDDLLYGLAGNDTLMGEEGADQLFGDDGNDELEGGAGNDQMYGGAGDDYYDFERGGGNDIVSDSGGSTDSIYLSGVLATDIKVTRDQHDLTLTINDTGDSITVAGWFDNSSAKIEQVELDDGTTWDAAMMESTITAAPGTGGSDFLYAGNNGDTLDGGAGNDVLYGGLGNDTYVVSPGGGSDVIQLDPGGTDTIMCSGYDQSSLTLYKSGSDMTVVMNDGSQITVTGYFSSNSFPIENYAFGDGTQLTNTELLADNLMHDVGNSGNDTLDGYEGNDYIDGGGGSDTIYGYEGNDQLYGGAGWGRDSLFGGAGNDYLDGGWDMDSLYGGAGSDVYFFQRGDGRDTIDDPSNGWWGGDLDVGGEDDVDTILFGEGISPADLYLAWDGSVWNGNVLSLQIDTTYSDVLQLLVESELKDSMPGGIEELRFSDGETMSVADFLTQMMTGTAGNDTLYGSTAISNNIISGLDGNDYLYGCDVGETLLGGNGDDYMDGYSGNDQIYGGAGNDSLRGSGYLDGGDGNDNLRGKYGDQINSTFVGGNGNDSLSGGSGDDLLEGGSGLDSIEGGGGADTYLFNVGDGADTIWEYDWNGIGMNDDIMSFGADIVPEDLTIYKYGDDLVITVGDNGDQITFSRWYTQAEGYLTTYFEPGSHPDQVGSFSFADGTVLTADELMAQKIIHIMGGTGNDTLSGGDSDDWIDGGAGADTLSGGAGVDTIYGGAGQDVLDGGAGNDFLNGGKGEDRYLFGLGSGVDRIQDSGPDSGNTIQFTDGVTTDNILVSRDGDDLVLSIQDTTDQVTVAGWFSNPNMQVTFTDGTVWDYATLEAMTQPTEVLEGTTGNDVLTGGPGDDVITGGAGSDTLLGGGGNDTFVVEGTDGGYDLFNGGDGTDTILGGAGDDTIRLHSFSGDNTVEVIDGGAGTNVIAGTGYGDTIDLSATALLNIGQIETGDGNDTVTGSDDDDVIIGGAGSDTLLGAGGNDTFVVDGTDSGYDLFNGGDGTDTILGGAGDDTIRLHSFSGDNTVEVINGGAGANVIAGTGYGDTIDLSATTLLNIAQIQTGDGNDMVTGSAGDDVIVGGAGSDTLLGGGGDDTFIVEGTDGGYDLFNGGDGTDTILGGAGDDTIRLHSFSGDNTVEVIDGGAGTNVIAGTGYGDTIDLSGTSLVNIAQIETGDGNDTVTGSAGNDVIAGGAGSDTLLGGGGNDTFIVEGTDGGYDLFNGGDGTDTILGGAGDDTIRLHSFNGDNTVEVIDGGAETNVIAGTGYGDTIDLSATTLLNIDHIDTGAGNDAVTGSAGDDVIVGGAGSDTLLGGGGNDTFVVEGMDGGYDLFNGGDGVDTILGGADDDTIRVHSFSGANTVEAIDGGAGTNVIAGTGYGDTIDLSGTSLLNIDHIDTGAGNDAVTGSAGDDVIVGGTGSDTLLGSGGNDTFIVEGTDSGYDLFSGGGGTDTILGGAGDDTIRLHSFSGDNTVEVIDGGAGTNVIAGTGYGDTINLSATSLLNIDHIETGDGNDMVTGSAGNDVIVGGAGSDTLLGAGGNDTFVVDGTDSGYDLFNGGDGTDTILGGAGDDTIRVHSFSGANTVETIDGGAGMNVIAGTGYGDTIDLSATSLVNIAQIDTGAGNDTVTGSAGDDVIVGGAGSDTLLGGGGDDTFVFALGDGSDEISDSQGLDTVSFQEGVSKDDVAIFMNNSDLIVSYGTGDQITIKQQDDPASAIDAIGTSDGYYLSSADINQIIQDMSAYAVNEGIALNSVSDVRNNEQLMQIVVNSWHA